MGQPGKISMRLDGTLRGAVRVGAIEAAGLGKHVLTEKVLDVKVDEEALTDDKPDIQLLKPFIYSPGDGGYHAIGVRIGDALVQSTPPE